MSIVDLSGEPTDVAHAEPLTLVSAEINQQIATARRYPRSIARARKSATELATLTQETAARCIYSLPRAGKTIEGPSARLAEIVAATWGNNRSGARVVGETEQFVVAQGIFHDLETNAAITVEVTRRIVDSKGKRFAVDMIGVTGAAACSIALRNAIFKGVPQALWWDVYQAAKATVMGDRKTLAQRRNAALEAFKPYGVTEAQIAEALAIGGAADMTVEHLATLHGFLTSIEEGTDPEEIFPPAATAAKPKAAAEPKAPAPPTPKPTPPPAAPMPAHLEANALVNSIADMLLDASSVREVESLRDMYRDDIAEASPEVRAEVEKMIADAAAHKRGAAA